MRSMKHGLSVPCAELFANSSPPAAALRETGTSSCSAALATWPSSSAPAPTSWHGHAIPSIGPDGCQAGARSPRRRGCRRRIYRSPGTRPARGGWHGRRRFGRRRPRFRDRATAGVPGAYPDQVQQGRQSCRPPATRWRGRLRSRPLPLAGPIGASLGRWRAVFIFDMRTVAWTDIAPLFTLPLAIFNAPSKSNA